jgi:hypothetical protein
MGMRVLTVGLLLAAAAVTAAAAQQSVEPPHAKPKFTLTGEAALLTVAIRPDKTADFEGVMEKMRTALLNSSDSKRRAQAAGWKLMKLEKPLPDGNVAYVHVIDPVVADADYAIMQTLYDAFPEERQALYELYRGAFVQNLSLATGRIILDLSKQPVQ